MINSDNLPGFRWSFLGLKGRLGVTCMLVSLTDVTSGDVVLNEGSHARPLIVTRDQFQCSVFTGVAGKGSIVAGLDDLGAELFIIGYVELIAIV